MLMININSVLNDNSRVPFVKQSEFELIGIEISSLSPVKN